MSLDLGTVTSAVILRDSFGGVLNTVIGGIGKFEDAAKKAFPSAAKFADDLAPAFGLATAAITATAVAVAGLATATFALASRGADVLDVAGTLEHFSDGALGAKMNLDALRAGVQGTVDDMTLMGSASNMLSAGVKLNSADFKTLGEAAFVMQNRGLGTTADMMDVVSNAMITGRTRALAMKLGVIDLGDAAENYAAKLGVEVESLSAAGKAEATRIQIMEMLSSAVADAGEQQLDFGERVDQAWASLVNWTDQLAIAVTQSPVLASLMDSIGEAMSSAFGANQENLIKNVVHWIEQGLIFTANLGIATVEATRVAYTAWKVVETVVLGVTTVIMGTVTALAMVESTLTSFAASLPGASESLKALALTEQQTVENLKLMTAGLAEQTKEAAAAVGGHSAFQQKLDDVGGALMNMRDKMVDASKQSRDAKEATTELTEAQKLARAETDRNSASMLDQAKMAKLQAAGLREASKLWGEYRALVVEHSGTATEKQLIDIENWENGLKAKMKEAHTDTKEFYEALEALSKEKTRGILIDWDLIRSKSLSTLVDQRDRAQATYNEMARHASGLTRGALQEQLEVVRETEFALTAAGQEAKLAGEKGTESAKNGVLSMQQWKKSIDETAAAARKLREGISFSFQVSSENLEATAQSLGVSAGQLIPFLKRGYSLQQALSAVRNPGLPPPPTPGPRMPGFAGGVENFAGGWAITGERGPEISWHPPGTSILPNGVSPGSTVNHFYVNGTAEEAARKIGDILMRSVYRNTKVS